MGRPIDLIVIHCSASPNGRPVTAAEIDRWHCARGFHRDPKLIGKISPGLKCIGYHYVITLTGQVQTGRGINEVGAHVAGHNATSVGICMVGTDQFTHAQWHSLLQLTNLLKGQYPDARLCGHRDLSPDLDGDGTIEPREWLKTCPGFDVAAWLAASKRPDPAHILSISALVPQLNDEPPGAA